MCRRFISCDDFASLQQHTSQTNQLPLSPTLTLAPFSINSYSSCLSRFSMKSFSWTFSRTCHRSKYWKLFNTSRFLLKDPLKINRMLAKNRHTASDFLNAFVFYPCISSHELSINVRHAHESFLALVRPATPTFAPPLMLRFIYSALSPIYPLCLPPPSPLPPMVLPPMRKISFQRALKLHFNVMALLSNLYCCCHFLFNVCS